MQERPSQMWYLANELSINPSIKASNSSCILSFFFVVVVYFILSRLLYLAFSANLGLLYTHPGMGPLV